MNCSDKYEILSAFADYALGADCDLSESERLEIERHISECAVCAQYIKTLTGAARELSRAAKAPVPADAAARLAAVVDAGLIERGITAAAGPVAQSAPVVKTDRGAWWRRLGSPAFTAAAGGLAVVALAVVIWGSPAERSQDTLSAPGGAPTQKSRGSRALSDSAPQVFTRSDIRRMVSESMKNTAGSSQKLLDSAPAYAPNDAQKNVSPDSGAAESAKPAPEPDTIPESGPVASGEDRPISAAEAARIAAGGLPHELIQGARGTFENRDAWIVIYLVTGPSESPEGAAVTLDGKVVFRAR